MKYYFIGIKGSGMSALASMMHDLGNDVRGSDVRNDFGFERGLKDRGIKIDDMTVIDEELAEKLYGYTFITSDSQTSNWLLERVKGDKYIYHEFLATIPGYRIGVCGTHGKTTTTKLLSSFLDKEKQSVVIGDGTGFGNIGYEYFLFESCEYKSHFLASHYDLLLVTNIEHDHPDYYKSLDEVEQSFAKVMTQAKKVIRTPSDYLIIEENKEGYVVEYDNRTLKVPFVGRHMVENFLLAYEAARFLGISEETILERVKNFNFPQRRFEIHEYYSCLLVSDYAHHPTEIKALYAALRQKHPQYKLFVLFQPHTYTRTITFLDEFVRALDLYDDVYIEEVFTSSREKVSIIDQMRINDKFNKYKKYDAKVLEIIHDNKEEKIVWVFLGAGTIDKAISEIISNK